MEYESTPSLDRRYHHVPYLVEFFTEELSSDSGKPKEGIQATIFEVPENIRRTNADSFEPKIVSLGPFHHGKDLFQETDKSIKLPYATNFFRRMDVKRIAERFVDWESDLRRAYPELGMVDPWFVRMMMLDCAFITEFLREKAGRHIAEKKEYSWMWATPSILNDMFLVENQVPLPPILYLLTDCTDDLLRESSLMEPLFHPLMSQIHQNLSPTSYLTSDFSSFRTSAHLLHLFHSSLVSKLRDKASHLHTDLSSFPSAEMLQAMRILFANKTNGSNFMDITFDPSKRSMEIPQLVINDDNISLLRNLIAFEQQCHGVDNYISTYVWFMDCLINTDKDVAVLRKNKIIVSRLRSDEEVAQIFNELRRTDAPVVDFENFYLAEVMNSVESYCRNRPNRFWALWNLSWLRQNYFKNRWVTIGVTAAIFFNLLTLVQTIYAVLSYAKQ